MQNEIVVGLAAAIRVAPWLRVAENLDRERVLALLAQLAELAAGRSVTSPPVQVGGLVLGRDDEIDRIEVPSGACAECVHAAVEMARSGQPADMRGRALSATALREAVVFFAQLDELADDLESSLADAEGQAQQQDAEALAKGERAAADVLARAHLRGEQLRETYVSIRRAG